MILLRLQLKLLVVLVYRWGIIFTRDKKISGITTAAGIWATAGIGMAIGADFWIFGSFVVL